MVTGGCGFIGSHIVDELLNRGIETYVIDNLSTGSINNIAKHLDNELFHFIQGGISDISELLSEVSGIEVIFHEATIASVEISMVNPTWTFDSNVQSSFKVLNYCKNCFCFFFSCIR